MKLKRNNDNAVALMKIRAVGKQIRRGIGQFRFRCRNVDAASEHLRKRRGRSSHHLIHHFTGGAHGHVVENELFIGDRIQLISHEHIQNQLHVMAAQHNHIGSADAFDIFDFNQNGRLHIRAVDVLNGIL